MHASQELVHHLHAGADAGPVAQTEHAAGHRGQDRLGRGKRLLRARGHDGERAGLCTHRAAGDGCIEERVAGSGEALAQCGREGGWDGAVEDHRRIFGGGRQRLGQRRLGLTCRCHHQDEQRYVLTGRARAGAGLPAALGEAALGLRVHIEAAHGQPGPDQMECHGQPHGTQPDEAHRPCCFRHPSLPFGPALPAPIM
jgi:hypothetical protein